MQRDQSKPSQAENPAKPDGYDSEREVMPRGRIASHLKTRHL